MSPDSLLQHSLTHSQDDVLAIRDCINAINGTGMHINESPLLFPLLIKLHNAVHIHCAPANQAWAGAS